MSITENSNLPFTISLIYPNLALSWLNSITPGGGERGGNVPGSGYDPGFE
jgi:hypothetical protein